jgi:hypothetical protein
MLMPQQFAINGRPTLALFFTTEDGAILCVHPDGRIEETPDEDLLGLRHSPLSALESNADVLRARDLASAYAESKQYLIQADDVYFD